MSKIAKPKAQSTVEYLLLFAVVVAVIVVAANLKVKPAVEKMMDNVADTIIETTNKLKDSF